MKKILLLMCIPSILNAVVIGSDSSVSRQARAFFKKATSLSNQMKGFSVFQNGFVLESPGTEASFDAFFPISGDVVLNGGTLSLMGDLEFKSPFRIGVGSIHGNGYSVELPRNISSLEFPSIYYIKLIVNLIDQVDVGYDVYSIDWNYDDQYVAVALRGKSNNNELKILQFDGDSFAEIASQDFGNSNLNTVRWHPTADYLATGASSGTELKTWFFNRSNNTINEIDSANIGGVNAVAWSNSGSFLAVGESNDSDLRVYPVSNGVLESVITAGFGKNVQVQQNAIDWDTSDQHIAVGTRKINGDELYIFYFNGSTLSKKSSFDMDTDVNDVCWRPDTQTLAIGLTGSSETIRLFDYNTATYSLNEIVSARVGSADSILGVEWNYSARYLAVSKQYSSQGYELEVYYFDDDDNTLHLVSGHSSDDHMRDVSWSHDGNYLASGGDDDYAYLFNFTNVPFMFKDLKLFVGSKILANASIYFEGDCIINGNDNIFDLQSTASLIVKPDSHLILEDIIIKGIANQNIQCMADSSSITLRNVTWVQDADTTFTVGSFIINDDVTFRGDTVLIYESTQTSTIASKARMILDSGFTFSYVPAINNPRLLEFQDVKSYLVLDGGKIYAGTMGMDFITGKIYVDRNATLSSDPTGPGITFGSGVTHENIYCSILSGMQLYVAQGSLNYKNSAVTCWQRDNFSTLHIGQNASLNLYSVLDIGNGTVQLDQGSTIHPIGSGGLLGRIYSAGVFTYQWEPS